jgi:hypothetical protein
MSTQRRELASLTALAAVAGVALLYQSVGFAQAPDAKAAAIPDFSGIWWHPSLPGPEPLASPPTGLRNLSRDSTGVSNYDQLVGDYHNPILQPKTAAVVKKFGEISLAGITFPSPANQCWPEPVPYIYKNFAIQIFQRPDTTVIIYDQDHEVRHIRMNVPHPAKVVPSWYGDSVGHYEGDTLVVDTIGTRTDRPFAMIDLYGTPYSDKLHVVERYRLVSYEEAKEGIERDAKENRRPPIGIDRRYRGKHLQLVYTVEDPEVFTMPWSATVTYGRGSDDWPETVCAENRHEYYNNKDSDVPQADKPDF